MIVNEKKKKVIRKKCANIYIISSSYVACAVSGGNNGLHTICHHQAGQTVINNLVILRKHSTTPLFVTSLE